MQLFPYIKRWDKYTTSLMLVKNIEIGLKKNVHCFLKSMLNWFVFQAHWLQVCKRTRKGAHLLTSAVILIECGLTVSWINRVLRIDLCESIFTFLYYTENDMFYWGCAAFTNVTDNLNYSNMYVTLKSILIFFLSTRTCVFVLFFGRVLGY